MVVFRYYRVPDLTLPLIPQSRDFCVRLVIISIVELKVRKNTDSTKTYVFLPFHVIKSGRGIGW